MSRTAYVLLSSGLRVLLSFHVMLPFQETHWLDNALRMAFPLLGPGQSPCYPESQHESQTKAAAPLTFRQGAEIRHGPIRLDSR